LIVYDRIKSVLPPYLSRHILALESAAENRWIGRHALVDALDAYVANMPSDKTKMPVTNAVNSKTGMPNSGKPRGHLKSLTVENTEVKTGKTLSNSGFVPKPAIRKKCYRCGSVSHLISNCPEKGETRAKANVSTASAQVNRCLVTNEHVTAASVGPGLALTDAKAEAPRAKKQLTDSVQQTVVAESHVDPILADGWSQLHYIDVHVKGLTEPVSTLYDSGAQLCCVDASVVESLNLPKLGHVMLKGLSSDLVHANLVCLHVKLSDANEFLPVTCAVCNNLNAPMLLGTC